MTKILGCPFCGHGGENYDVLPHDMLEDDYLRESPGFQMRCEYDGARGPEESTKLKALESWNHRGKTHTEIPAWVKSVYDDAELDDLFKEVGK